MTCLDLEGRRPSSRLAVGRATRGRGTRGCGVARGGACEELSGSPEPKITQVQHSARRQQADTPRELPAGPWRSRESSSDLKRTTTPLAAAAGPGQPASEPTATRSGMEAGWRRGSWEWTGCRGARTGDGTARAHVLGHASPPCDHGTHLRCAIRYSAPQSCSRSWSRAAPRARINACTSVAAAMRVTGSAASTARWSGTAAS